MISKIKLEIALRMLSEAHNQVRYFRSIISKYSIEKFGADPGDVDNDLFIDSCDGGCGESTGMTAEEFDNSMINSIK